MKQNTNNAAPGSSGSEKTKAEQPFNLQVKYELYRQYPLETWPLFFRNYLANLTEAVNCPIDFAGVAFVALVSVCLGNRKIIRVKSGYDLKANFFICIISPPGSKKSPALSATFKPLEIINRELKKDYERRLEDFLNNNDEKGVAPKRNKMYTTDSTTEALIENLVDNPGMALVLDELSSLIGSFNAYRSGQGSDKEFYLSLSNGSPIHKDRKGKEPIEVNNPFITIVGNITPDVLISKKDAGKIDDGLVDRLLCSYPARVNAKFSLTEISDNLLRKYIKEVYRIFDFSTYHEKKPKIYLFTDTAYVTFQKYLSDHHDEMNDPLMPKHLIGPWSKLEGQFAKLCLIIQCVWDGARRKLDNSQIEVTTVNSAARLLFYFKHHGIKVYNEIYGSDEEKRFAKALEWLENQGGTGTVRAFYTAKVAGCTTKKQADELLYQLQLKKKIDRKTKTPERGGQPSEFISLVKE